MFAVLSKTKELELRERGEDSASQRRWFSSSSIRKGMSTHTADTETDAKVLEPSQGADACCHRFRGNVTSGWDVEKGEIDKVIGGRKKLR
jgi:hypothetical protein